MDAVYAAIRDDLRRLREANVAASVYGGRASNFQMNPPLTEEQVRAFEVENDVVLPSSYRGFLIHVGNGGAGPTYGVFKLGERDAVDGTGFQAWKQNDGFVGTLSKPFPHTEAWNDHTGMPDYPDEEDGDQELLEMEHYRQMEEWERRHYFRTEHVNGAIPICHIGCNLRFWLVITGPEAGNLWDDARADMAGLAPLADEDGKRLTFIRWYRDWLDRALIEAQKQNE